MAEPYDLTPIPKKKLEIMQKKMYGKGGAPGQQADIDYFSEDNKGPV